jgi:cold shock CspA family protein
MRGTLTRFDRYTEIGMITSELGVEALMHKSSIEPSRWPLKQGQAVEFRIFYGPFGPLAENVRGVRV